MTATTETIKASNGVPYVDRNHVPLTVGQHVRIRYHVGYSQTAQVTGILKSVDMYAGVTITLDHEHSKNHGKFGMKYYKAGDDFLSVGIFNIHASKTEYVGEMVNRDVFYSYTVFIEVIND